MYPQDDNVLVNAPHPQTHVLAEEWTHPYSREKAAYPVAFLKAGKTWPGCGRVDEVFGESRAATERREEGEEDGREERSRRRERRSRSRRSRRMFEKGMKSMVLASSHFLCLCLRVSTSPFP